jgi:hypothetical protein
MRGLCRSLPVGTRTAASGHHETLTFPRAELQLRDNGFEAYGGVDVEQYIGRRRTPIQLITPPQSEDEFIMNMNVICENVKNENMISEKVPSFRKHGPIHTLRPLLSPGK